MTALHTRESLAAAAREICAGRAAPRNDFEKAAALFIGELGEVKLDDEAAVRASLYSALVSQAVANAPAAIAASPALLDAYTKAVAAQIRKAPPVEGMRFEEAAPVPRADAKAAQAEREELERLICLHGRAGAGAPVNDAHLQLAKDKAPAVARQRAILKVHGKYNARLAQLRRLNPKADHPEGALTQRDREVEAEIAATLPLVTAELATKQAHASAEQARYALVKAKIARGDWGSLGRCLDVLNEDGKPKFSAADQARMQVVNRAQRLGSFARLSLLLTQRVGGELKENVLPMTPAHALHHPHVQCVDARLLFLNEKPSEEPPAALAEGLGTWRKIELVSRFQGAWEIRRSRRSGKRGSVKPEQPQPQPAQQPQPGWHEWGTHWPWFDAPTKQEPKK